jgi:hypothetical protein
MKIICCGDSFFSLDKKHPNTHLSELLAIKLGASLENYAKLGASNFTIALQLEYAIKQNPDVITVGFTSVDRIEIPQKPYEFPAGIANIIYEDNTVPPSFYNHRRATTISHSIPNLEMTDTLKLFLANHYDPELKRQHDFFIASGVLRKLDKLNIKYVFTRGGLTGPDWSEWSNNEVDYSVGCPWHWSNGTTAYHTSFEKQMELSEVWFEKIDKLYNFV